MLFIPPQTPPETTGRSFLLACKALYMKISGSPGGESSVLECSLPPDLYCLLGFISLCEYNWPIFIWITLCMYIVSGRNTSNIYYFVLEKVYTSWYTIPVNLGHTLSHFPTRFFSIFLKTAIKKDFHFNISIENVSLRIKNTIEVNIDASWVIYNSVLTTESQLSHL